MCHRQQLEHEEHGFLGGFFVSTTVQALQTARAATLDQPSCDTVNRRPTTRYLFLRSRSPPRCNDGKRQTTEPACLASSKSDNATHLRQAHKYSPSPTRPKWTKTPQPPIITINHARSPTGRCCVRPPHKTPTSVHHDTKAPGIVATQGSPSTLKTPTPSYPGSPSSFVLSLGAHFSKIWIQFNVAR